MSTLPEKMIAIMAYAPEDYRIEERDVPRAGNEEVIIKILGCGICGSDMHAYHGAPMFWGNEKYKQWVKPPFIPGHEFFGEVVELGPGAGEKFDIALGDRITADQIAPCGKCRFCLRGQYWMCQPHNMYGWQKDIADGGMAEYMKLFPTAHIHKIPAELSFEDAAFIEPLACAIHTVQRATIEFEDVVVLAGTGPLGLSMVQLIGLKTPKKLVVLDLNEKRLELAKTLNPNIITMNPAKEDVVQAVLDMTDGYGCDVYIEASGVPQGVIQGMAMVRKLGRFVEFSVFSKETTTDWSVIGDRKELDVRGSHLGPYTYPIAIDLLQRGLVSTKGIVTDTFALKDFEAAMKRVAEPDSIKVVLKSQ
jgi:L-iditol 2-dehydrogenase